MKVQITDKHIKSCKPEGRYTPVDIALIDTDCFEEIRIRPHGEQRFVADVDGVVVPIPTRICRAIVDFQAGRGMKPQAFEFPIEREMSKMEDSLFLEAMEPLDLGDWY
ncbi:MAG: hypothetical protein NWR72_01890 [Bacteroidia bacterium]|nr:hypothetical protein [Bacteroidia bacterium]